MILKRFQEASTILDTFMGVMKAKNKINGMIWYHSMCLDLLLDATLTVVSYEDCCRFFMSQMAKFSGFDREACSRFYANCMLWNMRHGCFEVAMYWKRKLLNEFVFKKENSITGTLTGLRLLEVLALEMVYYIEIEDEEAFLKVETEIEVVTQLVSMGVKNSNLYKERLKLHRLHFKMLKNFDVKEIEKLKNLEKQALKSKDFLAIGIIKFTDLCWRQKLSANIENYWLHHSTEKTSLNVHQISSSDRLFPFSLPFTCKIILNDEEMLK